MSQLVTVYRTDDSLHFSVCVTKCSKFLQLMHSTKLPDNIFAVLFTDNIFLVLLVFIYLPSSSASSKFSAMPAFCCSYCGSLYVHLLIYRNLFIYLPSSNASSRFSAMLAFCCSYYGSLYVHLLIYRNLYIYLPSSNASSRFSAMLAFCCSYCGSLYVHLLIYRNLFLFIYPPREHHPGFRQCWLSAARTAGHQSDVW